MGGQLWQRKDLQLLRPDARHVLQRYTERTRVLPLDVRDDHVSMELYEQRNSTFVFRRGARGWPNRLLPPLQGCTQRVSAPSFIRQRAQGRRRLDWLPCVPLADGFQSTHVFSQHRASEFAIGVALWVEIDLIVG